jgi:hypothetical protein
VVFKVKLEANLTIENRLANLNQSITSQSKPNLKLTFCTLCEAGAGLSVFPAL